MSLRIKLTIFAVAYQFLYTPNQLEQPRLFDMIDRLVARHEEGKDSADVLHESLKIGVKALTGPDASPFEIAGDTLKVPVAFQRRFNKTEPFIDKYGTATIQVKENYLLLDIRDEFFDESEPIFRAEIWGKKTRNPNIRNKEKYDFDEDGSTSFFALSVFNFANELVKQVVPKAFESPEVNDEEDPDPEDYSGESNWVESGVLGIWFRARELVLHQLDEPQDKQLTDLLLNKFLPAETQAIRDLD